MNCKVKQGCLTSESCCILLWLAFTLFPVSVVTAADNRKIDDKTFRVGRLKGSVFRLPCYDGEEHTACHSTLQQLH